MKHLPRTIAVWDIRTERFYIRECFKHPQCNSRWRRTSCNRFQMIATYYEQVLQLVKVTIILIEEVQAGRFLLYDNLAYADKSFLINMLIIKEY